MIPSKETEGNMHDRILKRCLNSNRLRKKGRKKNIETRKKDRKRQTLHKLLQIPMYIGVTTGPADPAMGGGYGGPKLWHYFFH